MKKFDSIRDELIYLCKKNGGVLNPHQVVNFAQQEWTHLHSQFEWDDSKAAFEYRLEQARGIIRLEFEVINQNGIESKPVRLFVSLKDDRVKDGGYRLIENVMSDEDMRKKLVEEALYEFGRVRDRYKAIHELHDIFEAINKTELLVFEKAEAV